MSRIFRTTLRLDLDKPASAQVATLLRRLHEKRGISYSALIIPAVNAYYSRDPADEHLRETIRSIVREELTAASVPLGPLLQALQAPASPPIQADTPDDDLDGALDSFGS